MPEATLDLADLSLWADGFPDDVFVDLRRRTPVYHQSRTAIVDDRVGREFWVCTKHAEVTQVHRDHDAFTAIDGPLIQEVGLFSAYPAIVNLDPPDHTKRRRISRRRSPPAPWPSSRRASAPRDHGRVPIGRRRRRVR